MATPRETDRPAARPAAAAQRPAARLHNEDARLISRNEHPQGARDPAAGREMKPEPTPRDGDVDATSNRREINEVDHQAAPTIGPGHDWQLLDLGRGNFVGSVPVKNQPSIYDV